MLRLYFRIRKCRSLQFLCFMKPWFNKSIEKISYALGYRSFDIAKDTKSIGYSVDRTYIVFTVDLSIPWTILSLNFLLITFKNFFNKEVLPRLGVFYWHYNEFNFWKTLRQRDQPYSLYIENDNCCVMLAVFYKIKVSTVVFYLRL